MTKYASIEDANTGDELGTFRFNKNGDGTYSGSDGRKITAKNDQEAALLIAGNLPDMKGFELFVRVSN